MPYVVRRLFVSLMLIALVGSLGCAGGEEIEGVGECESNLDCAGNETCNLSTNMCEPLRTTNNSSNSSTPTNIGDRDTGFMPGNNSDTDAGMPDMAMETCTPECAGDQVCMGGMCVSACPNGCPNDQICTSDGCQYPDCTAVGDRCEPSNGDQGQFLCLSDESGEGTCAATCDESFAVSTCDSGEYCFSVSEDDMYKACLPSACQTSADCTNGTCVDFENEFSTCLAAGALAIGAACNTTMGDNCVAGAFCRETDEATGAGVCSTICDPWAASSQCPAGEACGLLLTRRTGLCTDNVDSLGSDPFEQCATPGTLCSDATRCFALDSTNACFLYCRPGENDCIGILPDGSDAICNNYVFNQVRTIGLCDGRCTADADCGAGARCDNQMCRRTCTVPDDCCATPGCGAQCVSGLCE